MLLGKQSLFAVRIIRNTQIHCAGKKGNYFNTRTIGTYKIYFLYEALTQKLLTSFHATCAPPRPLVGQSVEFGKQNKLRSFVTPSALLPVPQGQTRP
jgi:hypothetical protein